MNAETDPKEPPRKIAPEQVEILGAGETRSAKNPFQGTAFDTKNLKVISSGPWVWALPILIPILLALLIVAILPMILFGLLGGKSVSRKIVIRK